MSNEIKISVAGFSVVSQKRTSKAGSFFQICLPASLEAETLCLLFVFMSVPNHSIVFYSHGAIIKQNCSFGVGVGQHSVSVCIQCQAALGLGTAPSLALQQSLCPSWEVWLSLLSDWMWNSTAWCLQSHLTLRDPTLGTTQKAIMEMNSLKSSYFCTMDYQQFLNHESCPFCDRASYKAMSL